MQTTREFISYIGKTTGITVRPLSGKDEALWTYRGAVSGISTAEAPRAVLDIGAAVQRSRTPIRRPHGDDHLNRLQHASRSVALPEIFQT